MTAVFSNLIILIPISVVMYVAVRLNQADGVRRGNFVQLILHAICWILLVAGILGFSVWSGVIHLVWIFAFAACLFQLWLSQRRAERDVLLYLLVELGRQKRDLIQGIESCLTGLTFFRRLSLRATRNRIRDGIEWPVALARSNLCKGYPARLALRMESCYGPCQFTNHLLVGDYNRQGVASAYQGRVVGAVITIFITLVAMVAAFRALAIIPDIMKEFDIDDRSAISEMMVVLSSNEVGLFLLLLLVAIFLFLALLYFIPRLLNLAFFRWLFPGRHKTIALRALADMARYRPLTGEAFIELGNLYPIASWNLRFRKVGRMMKEGKPIEKALVSARVLTWREQRAVNSSLRADRFVWFLDTLVETRNSEELRRWLMLAQLLVLFEVVVLGLIVLWLGSYLYSILASMINEIA